MKLRRRGVVECSQREEMMKEGRGGLTIERKNERSSVVRSVKYCLIR